MSETNGTGILQRDVDTIDDLDDDAFRGLVEKRIEDVRDNKAIWTILYHPTLIERAEGCLEEIAEELHDAITSRGTLAIDAYRRECIRLELSPEPHDVALWDTLDGLTLPAGGDKAGPTLAEQITAGHWVHGGR